MTPADLRGTPAAFSWSHGRGEIWPLSAALHHLAFRLPDGREVMPLAEAPWQDDVTIAADAAIPAHHRQLGGEWPCAPFGRSAHDPVLHGLATDSHWRIGRDGSGIHAVIDLPEDRAVARIGRTLRPVDGEPAVDITLTIHPRRDVRMPVGLHPVAALPASGQGLQLDIPHRAARTLSAVFEPGISRFAPDVQVRDLAAVPLADGGTEAVTACFSRPAEEGVFLEGVSGRAALLHRDAHWRFVVTFDPAAFPNLLLWISTGGRTAKPWGGRFRGLGIEPINGHFAMTGTGMMATGGPELRAGQPFTTRYRLSVEAL